MSMHIYGHLLFCTVVPFQSKPVWSSTDGVCTLNSSANYCAISTSVNLTNFNWPKRLILLRLRFQQVIVDSRKPESPTSLYHSLEKHYGQVFTKNSHTQCLWGWHPARRTIDMNGQTERKSRWWMDGIWQARQERRPKEIPNPKSQKHVMQRACADSDMEPAWASWQHTEDMAFTRPFSGASQGRQTVLLEGWGCRTETWGLERETHVHGTANRSLCLSHYLTKESWLKIQAVDGRYCTQQKHWTGCRLPVPPFPLLLLLGCFS